MRFAGGAILVSHAGDIGAIALHFLSFGVRQDAHVRQAPELVHQHGVGAQLRRELDQRHMLHDAGKINGGLDAGVATAHHRHFPTLEQRAVAVRAVRHAMVAVFLFAGHAQFAPARAGGDDHGLRAERGTTGEAHLGELAGNQLLGALQVHDVHVVGLHVLFQRHREFGPFGVRHGDQVLDAQRVEHLATEALGGHADANALARRIDGGGGTRGATAHDQHIVWRALRELHGLALRGAGVELGEDFLDAHAALAERLAVQVHRGHRADIERGHFLLEQRAIDHGVADARVQHRHRVQRLDHVGAVLAGKRNIGAELEVALEVPDLLDDGCIELGRIAARLQQGQHQ